jgi:hypothetical protein
VVPRGRLDKIGDRGINDFPGTRFAPPQEEGPGGPATDPRNPFFPPTVEEFRRQFGPLLPLAEEILSALGGLKWWLAGTPLQEN